MITALSSVLMIIAGFVPIGLYTMPALASILFIVLIDEVGCGYTLLAYAATSVVALFIAFDKEPAINFILFFGFYPIIKHIFEKIRLKPIAFILKLLVFNAGMVAVFYVGTYLLMIPTDSYSIFGVYLPWLFLLVGNAVFVIYDYALTGIFKLYRLKYSKFVKKIINRG